MNQAATVETDMDALPSSRGLLAPKDNEKETVGGPTLGAKQTQADVAGDDDEAEATKMME